MRQSAFALVGDMSKVCAQHLLPVTADLIRLGIAQLEPAAIRQDTMSACNNACWSLGAPSLLSCTTEGWRGPPRRAQLWSFCLWLERGRAATVLTRRFTWWLQAR